MFESLRTKLLIGLTPLLVLIVGLGVWAIVMFSRLGGNIDVILKENYRSVLYAQKMQDAIEQMDSALLFGLAGEDAKGRDQFARHRPEFEENLRDEGRNITIEGEQELADRLTMLYGRYAALAERYFALPAGATAERRTLYFAELLPVFTSIKETAAAVLDLNQKNMEAESARARAAAEGSIRLMALALLGAIAVGTAIALAMSASILGPIQGVTRGARGMARGDLDQVVPVRGHDELGQLADAFNVMARRIRELQQAGADRLLRAQKTAQATIDSFPDPVVVVDPAGSVERANPAARRLLGLAIPDRDVLPWSPPPAVRQGLDEVLGGRADVLPTALENAILFRDDGQERFFLPRVLSIRGEAEGLLGAAVVLQDVTKFRLVDQLKSDMVSTVSHELKTPLTSVQMALHLLLEEVVGPLTSKQIELLMAARQDSDRLLAMVNDLLDLTRIEQGRIVLELAPVAPDELARDAVARFAAQAEDRGIALAAEVAPGLPAVRVDRERVDHVFDNLIGNALRYTGRNGRVVARAEAGDGVVIFRVTDTGSGIPAEHLPRIFEKFYRVPGSAGGGAGLGLAIAREIVEAHGGRIEAAGGEGGRGTTFTVTLPVAPDEPRGPHPNGAVP